jgi:hypothetical protein
VHSYRRPLTDQKHKRRGRTTFLGQVVQGLVLIVILLWVLAYFGVSLPSLLTTSGSDGVHVSVSNRLPAQDSPVTVSARLAVDGQPIANVPMTATWHYKTSTPSCSGMTDANGVASCTRYIGGASFLRRVLINVSFIWNGHLYTGETSFWPR